MTKPYSHKFKEIRNIDKFRCPSCNVNCGMSWFGPRGKIVGSFDTAKSGCDRVIIYLDVQTGKYYSKLVYYPKNNFEALFVKKTVEENVEDIEVVDFFKEYRLPYNKCIKKETCPAAGLNNHFCMNYELHKK